MPEIQFHQKKGLLGWDGTDWVPVKVTALGEFVISGASADGTIVDGVDDSIKATVFNYTGSNPLAVTLVDEDGAQYNAGASGGPAATVELEEQLDYDSGAGTVSVSVVGMALPGAGGPVAGGTSTNPIQIGDAGGSLTVDGTVAVTGVSTAANQATEITSLQLIDDIVYVDDADWTDDTSKHALVGGVYQATPHTVTDGDVTPFLTDVNGRLATVVSGTVTVGSHAVTNAGTFVVQENGASLTALQLIDDVIYVDDADWTDNTSKHALVGGVYQASPHTVTDGDVTPFLTDVNGRLATVVSGTVTVGSHAVTNAGTFAVQVDGSALTALQLIDDPVLVLGTATYSEATTKGMAIAAIRRDADTTLVDTTNEAAPLQVDARGALKVECFSGETLPVSLTTTAVTNAGTFVVQENGAALTSLQLIDDSVVVLGTATYTEAASKGLIMAAVRRDADTTLVDTTNEYVPLQVDAAGKLKVEIFDGGDSHTVDNAGTFAVQVDGNALTALQLIDDIVYTDDTSTHATGTSKGALIMAAATPTDSAVNANDIGAVAMTTDRKLHVAVMDALPAGSAAIGKLAANSGVIIGDVNIVSNIPGVAATSLGKAEDAAHTTADTGVMALSVRKNTAAATSDADGDYQPLITDTNGRLHVLDANSASALTSLQLIDDVIFAEDVGHNTADKGIMALAVRSAAPSDRSAGPTDGDYEPLAVNEVGAVWVSVTPSANGGATTLNSTSSDGGTALTNSAQAIKASAGSLKGYYIYNPNTSAQFVQFYNTASGSVTVGTTNPLFMLTVPAQAAANLWMPDGVAFGTAISWSATSTAGGNGAPTTSLDAVAWYK